MTNGTPFAPPVIAVSGLQKRYRKVEALRGLDLTVPRGSVFSSLSHSAG